MDGMKKLLITTVAILIAAGIFALLLNLTKNDIQNQVNDIGGVQSSGTSDTSRPASASDTSREELPEIGQDYVFMTYYKNLSYNADIAGFIIDKNGKRYDYKLTGNTKELSPEETFAKVADPKKLTDGTDFISDGDIHNLYNVLNDINTKADIKAEGSAGDYGTTTLYALKYSDGKPQFIKIYSFGDISESPTDPNSMVIQKYFVKKLKTDDTGAAVVEE